MPEATVVRVAHAYGNRPSRIADAIAAGVDLIETDLRYERGRIWIRHERRAWPLPLLYDRGLRGLHRVGPWAISLGSFTLRMEPRPLFFEDVLAAISGRGGIMIDFKRSPYDAATARSFVSGVARTLDATGFSGRVDFCGSWPLQDLARERMPSAIPHYSIDQESQWHDLTSRLCGDQRIDRVTIHPDLLTLERARELQKQRIEYYVWDITDRASADHALARGASGIIADDLTLLRALASTPVRTGNIT